jgi:hypothetical protein
MAIISNFHKSLMLAALLGFSLQVPTEAAVSGTDDPFYRWQRAAAAFKSAGEFIGADNLLQVKAELAAATSLPAPYNQMAASYLEKLDAAVQLSTNRQDRARTRALVQLCDSLRAHRAGLYLTSADREFDSLYAWRLIETGETKAGLEEYRRKLSDEIVEIWQEYYREQIALIEKHAANQTNAALVVELVRKRYLKGLEAPADLFSALTVLTGVLPHAGKSPDAVPVYQLILKCLSGLSDEVGREAWQDKFLGEFKSDPEVVAEIYCDRAMKAYAKKDWQRSQALFQQVCTEFAKSSSYGNAQYGLGLVFQEQKKCDQAIVEFAKLFSSKVNDMAIDPANSEDYANYRFRAALRISECYESKNDPQRALEYALIARDKYKFVSFCKNCMRETHQNVQNRVERLQAGAKKLE